MNTLIIYQYVPPSINGYGFHCSVAELYTSTELFGIPAEALMSSKFESFVVGTAEITLFALSAPSLTFIKLSELVLTLMSDMIFYAVVIPAVTKALPSTTLDFVVPLSNNTS